MKVWCLLVGPVGNVCGQPFRVFAQHTAEIEDLKILVREARPNRLSLVDTADIVVLRTKDSPPLETEDNLQDRVSELFEGGRLEKVAPSKEIKDLGLGGEEVLIVQCNYLDPKPQGKCYLPDTISSLTFLFCKVGMSWKGLISSPYRKSTISWSCPHINEAPSRMRTWH
jgi:hypothetical protein